MNEDELRREFERLICSGAFVSRWEEWLHVAHWADTRARRECAEICERQTGNEAWECADEIRATIKEPSNDLDN